MKFSINVVPLDTSMSPYFLGALANFLFLSIFPKPFKKIQDWLKSGKKTGTLHVDLRTFMTVSSWILLRIRNVSDRSCKEIKTHILCSINVFRKSYRLWDNVEKYCRTRRATDNTAHAHCVLEKWVYRHTLRICNTYCFSTATMVTRTRLCYVCGTHIACLVSAFCGQWYQHQRYANLWWEEEQYLLQDTAWRKDDTNLKNMDTLFKTLWKRSSS